MVALPVAEPVGYIGKRGKLVDYENVLLAFADAVETAYTALRLMGVGHAAVVDTQKAPGLSGERWAFRVVGVDVGHVVPGKQIVVDLEVAWNIDTIAAWHAGVALHAFHGLQTCYSPLRALRARGARCRLSRGPARRSR